MATQTPQHPNCRTMHVASRGRILSSMPPCSQMKKPSCAQTPPLENCRGSLSARTPLPQPHPETQLCSYFQGLSSAAGWRRDRGCAQKEQQDLEKGSKDRNGGETGLELRTEITAGYRFWRHMQEKPTTWNTERSSS